MPREQKWTRVENVAEFLKAGRKVSGVHSFSCKILHWPYCKHCGLVLLKNDVSRKLASGACTRLED